MSHPTGTVTFLDTDVEGSSQLVQRYPEAMPAALARHHALLQKAMTAHHGFVFRRNGDELNVAFDTAPAALDAALAAQRALNGEAWGPTGALRVRMSLHTGPATARGNDYDGYLTLSYTKRLMSVAYGGQILVSPASQALLRDQLPPGVTLRDLGEHRLKDFDRPEPIFQVVAPDLPADFPPLRTLGAFPNNLPLQLTSFVGRERELAEVKQLLSNTRLLTLTGPGGTGKTRLSLQLAADVLEDFIDGVWLVELAPLADPTLLAQTVAAALNVREQPQRSITDGLTDYLRGKSLLLILDNCEHLIDASAQLANTLLRAAPGLKILASSREALGIAGETAYRVPSLPLPDLQAAGLDALKQNDSVRLFVDRALAASPHFHLTEKNAPAVVEVCRRLDGIPLAIELAAARTKVFPPEQIAARLDDRFRLLTGGSRTAMERHQTLRALIDWSYDFLSEGERTLLRRLAVFAGGWSFEAAQAVCSEGLHDDALDLLTHLVDKSLISVEEETEEGRYRLLETIRQYARDKLFESGEVEQVRERHLGFFTAFAEAAEPKLRSGEQLVWLDRLETEHDNLRTALSWSLESGKSDRALQLAGALSYFWELREVSEGSRWLNEALALTEREQNAKVSAGESYTPTSTQKAWRAQAIYGAARLSFMSVLDQPLSLTMGEESLRLWRELGNKWWTAVALEHVGFLSTTDDYQRALACLEEAVVLAREVEDRWPLALCLVRLGGILTRTDAAAARRIREEGIAVARRVGDKSVLSQGLQGLVPIYQLEGNLTMAESVAREALEAARALKDFVHEMLSLVMLVTTACLQRDLVKAKGYCFQALDVVQETGTSLWLSLVLLAFGLVATFSEQPGRGARLFAAGDAMLRERGVNLPIERAGGPAFTIFNQALEKARAQLGPEAFEVAMAEGRALTLEQALALATEKDASVLSR